MKNWLSKFFFFAVAAVVVGGIAMSFMPEPQDVDFAVAKRQPLLVTVDEDGKTRIREKYVVSTPLSGRLLRIAMDPGDTVTASETLLATIEPRDPELLDARAIAQAEARVSAADASLKKTEPMLETARLEQANAETELQRARSATQGGGMTASELDAAKTRYRQASEELRASRYAQEIAEFELQQARAALVRSKPQPSSLRTSGLTTSDPASEVKGEQAGNGWNFTIRSPITGRVLQVFQESAAVVTAGMSLLELGDPTDLEVVIDVLSSDAVKIEPGARVILEHWGGDHPLEGQVRLVEPAGFTKISTLGVEEQRVNVIVDLVDPPADRLQLGDGFRVEARIVTAEVPDALCVPTSALFRSAGEWSVFKVVDSVATLERVEIGKQNGLLAEVQEGLGEGDVVIVNPSDQVVAGVEVRER